MGGRRKRLDRLIRPWRDYERMIHAAYLVACGGTTSGAWPRCSARGFCSRSRGAPAILRSRRRRSGHCLRRSPRRRIATPRRLPAVGRGSDVRRGERQAIATSVRRAQGGDPIAAIGAARRAPPQASHRRRRRPPRPLRRRPPQPPRHRRRSRHPRRPRPEAPRAAPPHPGPRRRPRLPSARRALQPRRPRRRVRRAPRRAARPSSYEAAGEIAGRPVR